MRRLGSRKRTLILGIAVASLVGTQLAAASTTHNRTWPAGAAAVTARAPLSVVPRVTTTRAFGVSAAVVDLPKVEPPSGLSGVPGAEEEGSLIHPAGDGSYHGPDPIRQAGAGSGIPPTSQDFEGNDIGESSADGVFVGAPPDTNGDVGPNHYLQIVNTVFSVYSKTGTRLSGPTPIDNLWRSAPNAAQFDCTTQSRGDPVAQYDPMADRWLITQFDFPGAAVIAPPFDECIAVSQTPDPTGAYFLYDFNYSATLFNDYPHFGVWPDAYYMSVNQFDTTTQNTDFNSGGACAFERLKMLAGDASARQVCFDESTFDPKDASGNYIYGGQLPTDLDGSGVGAAFQGAPPAGEPNFFMQFIDSTTAGADKLLEFRFHVDWTNPANSTFGDGTAGGAGRPISIPVADFDAVLCEGERSCLPQKDSPDGLDAIADRLMYRLAYRRIGGHESLVLNHTVNVAAAPTDHAGIRWYELRDPNGAPIIQQQSTYAPDAEHRWMGSIGMDAAGDIALGYSLTSADRHPAIAYSARRASDPAGQMSLGEGLLYQGAGSQTGTDSRWGDYSSMSVDPNGCTFWYTTEHYLGTGTFNWGTRIGSFTLPSCGDPQISLGASATAVRVRSDYSYTIGVTTGQSPVTGASVADLIPANTRLLAATSSAGSCTWSSTLVCDLGDLPAGDLETIQLTVHTQAVGASRDTATLTTTSPDPVTSNNTATLLGQVYDSCVAPGAVMATDPGGDQTGTSQQDIESVAVAEPYFGAGTNRIVFTLKAHDLGPTPQPNSYWYEHFSYAGVAYFVDMETVSDPTFAPTFHYGRFDVDPTSGLNTQNVLGDADAGTFAADGTITITLANSKLVQDPDPTKPANGTPPAAGSVLAGVHGETRTLVGVLLALADTTSGAAYTLSGNAFCAPNTPPTAGLRATPTSGVRPLTVALDASSSTDPDAGDHVASFTFYFGDGATPVTQSSPTISHVYAQPGTYHATLTVMDSRGQESTNAPRVDIQVASPSADLGVVKTGPSTGKAGHALSYSITVTNHGPSSASGIVLADTLPSNIKFGSATSTQGTCALQTGGSVVLCNIGTIASGASVQAKIVFTPKRSGSYIDTAKVRGGTPSDPNAANDVSSVTTTVK
jgi:uncharacterized repeat protein (TIGR01451 family)